MLIMFWYLSFRQSFEPRLSLLDRTQKLKDARTEAAKEIEDLKAKKEKEFQAFQKEVSSRPTLLTT